MITLRRILLVEDNSRDVELTLKALQEFHMVNAVDVARDGVEALDYLYRRGKFADRPLGQPVVVMLDIKMPRLNGLEVLRRIKADPELKNLAVVMFTSSQEPSDVAECHRLGVNAYVVKPVDFSQFAAAVKQIAGFWASLNELPPPESPQTQ